MNPHFPEKISHHPPVSKIPPKNQRPLLKPLELKASTSAGQANCPVLNQLLSFQPNPVSYSFQIKKQIEKNSAIKENLFLHQQREQFFNSLVDPPEKLPVPEMPKFNDERHRIASISIHKSNEIPQVSGPILIIKDVTSESFSKPQAEDKPIHMHPIITQNFSL